MVAAYGTSSADKPCEQLSSTNARARCHRWSLEAGGSVLTLALGAENRWCAHVQRPHRSNGTVLRVDLRTHAFAQGIGATLKTLPIRRGYYRASANATIVVRCPDSGAGCGVANECAESTSGCFGTHTTADALGGAAVEVARLSREGSMHRGCVWHLCPCVALWPSWGTFTALETHVHAHAHAHVPCRHASSTV